DFCTCAEFGPINRTERLEIVICRWNRHHRAGRLRLRHKIFQKLSLDEGEIDSQNQVPVCLRSSKRSVNSAKRSATGKNVWDDWAEWSELFGVTHDSWVAGDCPGEIE